MSDDEGDQLIGKALGLDRYTHHVLVCEGPRCCNGPVGSLTRAHLETRLKELERKGRFAPRAVFVSRVSCLKICRGGPILVVYPGAVWYRGVTVDVVDQIVQRHLLRGEIVESHAFCQNPDF